MGVYIRRPSELRFIESCYGSELTASLVGDTLDCSYETNAPMQHQARAAGKIDGHAIQGTWKHEYGARGDFSMHISEDFTIAKGIWKRQQLESEWTWYLVETMPQKQPKWKGPFSAALFLMLTIFQILLELKFLEIGVHTLSLASFLYAISYGAILMICLGTKKDLFKTGKPIVNPTEKATLIFYLFGYVFFAWVRLMTPVADHQFCAAMLGSCFFLAGSSLSYVTTSNLAERIRCSSFLLGSVCFVLSTLAAQQSITLIGLAMFLVGRFDVCLMGWPIKACSTMHHPGYYNPKLPGNGRNKGMYTWLLSNPVVNYNTTVAATDAPSLPSPFQASANHHKIVKL